MKTESTASIYRMGGRRKRQKRLTASSAPAKRVYRHVGTNEKPDDVYNDVGSVKTHFSGHLPGSAFSLSRDLFPATKVRVHESFDGTAEVPPAIYSIPTRVRTMILSSNSPTLWGGRMPTHEARLNHDHRMCRAVLPANPGLAAHSSPASAASSTTTPPASVPRPLSPAHDTSAEPIVDTHDASPAYAAPHSAPLPPAGRAETGCLVC